MSVCFIAKKFAIHANKWIVSFVYLVHRLPPYSSTLEPLHMLLMCTKMSSFSATQLCEDLFEKINEDNNKEELSYSVEVSLRLLWHL